MKSSAIAAGLIFPAFLAGAETIPDNAKADLVIGHSDFVTGGVVSPTSSFTISPQAIAVDPVSRKVFIADVTGYRILRYRNADDLANGAGAEMAFGQKSFNASVPMPAAEGGLGNPYALFFDRMGRLWVADLGYHRVVMYESAVYRAMPAFPDRFFGQPDFTTVTPGVAANKFSSPAGLCLDKTDRLWIADTGSNRVLRIDNAPGKASGSPANGVLGQVDFVTGTAGTGATGFNAPPSVAISGAGVLFVVDSNQHRVLRFDNAAGLTDGSPANAVLGQPDLVTVTPGLSEFKLSLPFGLWLTAYDNLWVADYLNHRVVRFNNASTKTNGAAADGVIGQANFFSNVEATNQRGLRYPRNAPFADSTGALWVSDLGNNRVVRYSPDETRPTLGITSNVPDTTTKTSLRIAGIASDNDGVARVKYRRNSGPLKVATGTKNWEFTVVLTLGDNVITIFAVDAVGNRSGKKVVTVKRTN